MSSSFCLSQTGIVPKSLKAGSRRQRLTIAPLVFWSQRYRRISNGVSQKGAPNTGGAGKNRGFSPISRYASETVHDMDIVTMERMRFIKFRQILHTR